MSFASSSKSTLTASSCRLLRRSGGRLPSSPPRPHLTPKRPSRTPIPISQHNTLLSSLPAFLLPSQHYASPSASRRSLSTSSPRPRPRHPPSPSSSITPTEFAFPSHLSNPTPYDIFHFPSRAVSSAEVKSRYYDLVRALHPDRLSSSHSAGSKGKSKTQAEEEFKCVVSAYDLLKDPGKKRLYDRAGIGWSDSTPLSSPLRGSDPWRNFQDPRYTRRSPAGHDRFGWQNEGFYSSHTYNPHHPHTYSPFGAGSAGWNGRGKYTSNGIFISSLFVLTWILAGLQYSRLSLQSQKAIERADKSHLDAAKSLNEARESARSEEGRERWRAFRRRARERKVLEETEAGIGHLPQDGPLGIEAPKAYQESVYGVGHGGPSGKQAAQERFAKAQAAKPQSEAQT